MTTTLLAVNGTLMRGLELNPNMQKAGGIFVREDRTDAHYRLWSINDRHPGMIRVNEGGAHVDVEIWQLPLASFAELLMNEPEGLTIGKIKLADGSEVLGVLAESWLTEGQKEITALGAGANTPGIFTRCNAHL
ncbi:glutamyl-tRNA amidotransferase [Escherichia coli]|nr:glutamyl-tRNA amidotransferase [Escherichia coli]MCZ5816365.1 glutamyl-tRNA amidotransferase [Escherichia coli]